MRVGETELQMVQRHVQQGELIILRQHEIIANLTSRNLPTDLAEDLLLNFEATQLAHKDHLNRLISN